MVILRLLSNITAVELFYEMKDFGRNWLNFTFQLQHLELVCLRESLDLAQVARQCPNLQILEIYYSQAVHVSSPIDFRFGKLDKLIIYSTDILGPDAQQVSCFMSHFFSCAVPAGSFYRLHLFFSFLFIFHLLLVVFDTAVWY